jgi:hypothetical protein
MSINALNRYREQPSWEETAGRIRDFLQVIAGSTATEQSLTKREIAMPPNGGSQ